MKKTLWWVLAVLLSMPGHAQNPKYKGGNSDGFVMGAALQTNVVGYANKFTGGAGDGFVQKTFVQNDSIPYSDKYSGGVGDGYVLKTLSQNHEVDFSDKYTGGTGDGFARYSFVQKSTVAYTNKYTGGIGDGSVQKMMELKFLIDTVFPTCKGLSTGAVNTIIRGGCPPFTVIWTNTSQTGKNLTNLSENTYQGIVTDFLNNSDTVNAIVGNKPLAPVPFKPMGEISVCQNGANGVYKTAKNKLINSFIWTITPTTAGTVTGNDTIATIDWNNTYSGQAFIKVKGVNECGEGPSSDSLQVTINALPSKINRPTGQTLLCSNPPNADFTTSGAPNATSYIWEISPLTAGSIQNNGLSATINWTDSYVGMAYLVVKGQNSCGVGDTSMIRVNIANLPASAGTLTGAATVCQGQGKVNYTVPVIANATSYIWTLPSGATGTSTTNSILVDYGASAVSGNITVKGSNACGGGTASILAVTVNTLPSAAGTITGNTTVCQGTKSVTYTVPIVANATSYIWTLPSGVSGTSTTNTITVDYMGTAVSGNITVKGSNACGGGTASILPVTVNTLPSGAGTITGSTSICQGQSKVSYTVPEIPTPTSYIWTLPTGATGTSTTDSITVDYGGSAVSGNITVKRSNTCGVGTASTLAVTVNVLPTAAGTITGSAAVCQGQGKVSYTVPVIANATSYIWTLPSGAAGTSTTNSILVDYGASAVSGNITVKGSNTCGVGTASTLAVTLNTLPSAAGTITGNTTVCQGTKSVTYTVQVIANATSYIWTIPSGVSGTSTTNTITVDYMGSAVSGNVTVKGSNTCGVGTVSILPVTVNTLPSGAGTITGSTSICQGQSKVSYTVPEIPTPTSYIWTLPTGATGTSTTDSITVDYGESAVSGDITVKRSNTCGVGTASTLKVTVNTLPSGAGTITGNTTICQGQNKVSYTVPVIANATSYIWILPLGATGTSTTNSIYVDYGASAVSGNITVKGSNTCGVGTASTLAVTVNTIPIAAGTITGTTTVCQGTKSLTYTVPVIDNATSYIWTLPSGVSGNSTTNTITVDYMGTAVSGDITVKGNNACGNGTMSTLAITVNSNCNSHFTPVWTGNGYDHMNINIHSAKLDGVGLVSGDEIGIFDGSKCVGYGILSDTLSSAYILNIAVSRKEGTLDGYTTGNGITFKLFDKSKNLEISNPETVYSDLDPSWSTDGKFTIDATAFVALKGFTVVKQDIALIAGWNIVSANVVPANVDLKNVFQPLITAGKLQKVMDEAGKTIENFGVFGGWKNNIGNLNSIKGYKVNLTNEATLTIEGVPVVLPLEISLMAGWNIISYPCSNLQDAKGLLQSLIDAGKLKKVMDESGKTIENFGAFGGWKNNIGNFVPGKGYKVNATSSCTLTIPKTSTKAAVYVPEVLASTHFAKVFSGNGTDHFNINLVDLETSGLKAGDEIGIFDGQYCVGAATIGEDQLKLGSISIPASANEGTGNKVNGFSSGNTIGWQLYRGNQSYKLEMETLVGIQSFEKNGSVFVKAKASTLPIVQVADEQDEFRCYPNPFTDELTIYIQNSSGTEVNVEVYNLLGQKIKSLFKGTNEGELILKWNGTNDSGQQIIPGVYLVRMNNETKKVSFK